MLTQEKLKEHMHYNSETGIFTRTKPLKYQQKSNSEMIGSICNGYRIIYVCGKPYKAHRLAFLYMKGYFPKMVDHINGIKDDNRWINLRPCNYSVNNQNRHTVRRDSKTGFTGVYLQENGRRYRAYITINYKRHELGSFDTAEEDSHAYLIARKRMHPWHSVNVGEGTT